MVVSKVSKISSSCVEYLTEDSSNNYSETEIQNLAREQWLLNDLKEICPGSLPANLKTQQKVTLNGRFALQINAAVDIGNKINSCFKYLCL